MQLRGNETGKISTVPEANSSYYVETYSVLQNVDRSILILNQLIKDEGYEFVEVSLTNLEKRFRQLFSLPKTYEVTHQVTSIDGVPYTISIEFSNTISRHNLAGHDVLQSGYMIFLRDIKRRRQEVVNFSVNNSKVFKHMTKMQDYVSNLVRRLRLFKSGDIVCASIFQIAQKSRTILAQTYSSKDYLSRNKFGLDPEELLSVSDYLKKNLIELDYVKLAESHFMLAYEIKNDQVKFVNMIVALEALFNQGSHPTSHVVSRHMAIVVSKTREEFLDNYKRVKKLYGIRSKIVHGQINRKKLKIRERASEAQDLVRKGILYCMGQGCEKDVLFHRLNSMGFSQ